MKPGKDPYGRLRSPPPTPDDESCACSPDTPLLLAVWGLTPLNVAIVKESQDPRSSKWV
jgi:hypothetical protein